MNISSIENIYYKNQHLRWVIAPFLFGPHATLVEYLVSHHGRNKKRVLDIGSRNSPYTSSLSSTVVGIDLPAEEGSKLGFTISSLEKFKQGNRLPIYGSGENLPLKPASIDVVLMVEVIEHLDKDREALKEAHRVLKPGGVLLLTTPNGETFPIPSKHHCRHYARESLKDLVESFFAIEYFWSLFPQGKLWRESVKSVKTMLKEKATFALLLHLFAVCLYWPYTIAYFISGKTKGTTSFFLIGRKK